MIDSGHGGAVGNREVDLRIVQHPLGVVGLNDGRRGAEERRIEADGLFEVFDSDVNVQAFQDKAPSD